jgi:hypothetical protein
VLFPLPPIRSSTYPLVFVPTSDLHLLFYFGTCEYINCKNNNRSLSVNRTLQFHNFHRVLELLIISYVAFVILKQTNCLDPCLRS